MYKNSGGIKMKRNFNVVKGAIASIAVAVFLVGCSDKGDTPVAKVNGVEISEATLQEALKNQYGSEMLDVLITNEIIKQEAEATGIKLTDEELDAEYANYAEYYGGEEGLLAALEPYNMDEEDIMKDITTYLLTMKLMEKEIDLTDEELLQYYEDNKESYLTDEGEQQAYETVQTEVHRALLESRIDEEYENWLNGKFEEYDIKSY